MINFQPHEATALADCRARIPAQRIAADTAALAAHISEGRTDAITALITEGLARFGQPYPLLLAIAGLPALAERCQHLGLPETQYQGALADIRRWTDTYSSYSEGAVGLPHPSWIARILTARIYHLGALQVEERACTLPYRIYRSQSEGLVAFAEGGLALDSRGYVTATDQGVATTEYTENQNTIIAHRVAIDEGTVSLESETIAHAALTFVAGRGTPMLYTHIPARTDLSAEAVDASFSAAQAVFGENSHFFTVTWLVDPALAAVTDSGSKIRSFMERFAKFSLDIPEVQLYEKVFAPGFTPEMILAAQSKTSLQKRVQDALRRGVRFRTTGGYLVPKC
ncbi:MAG TPA: hypothetical protein VFC80_07285 [Sphaerochaeta sp.]|nr:hypothetical protein [Sphaerochaeta sp.]